MVAGPAAGTAGTAGGHYGDGVGFADRLTRATDRLLDGLDERQRSAATFPFGSAARRHWVYWPEDRPGVALHELGRAGTKDAHRLLATLLPRAAFARAVAIMGLDEVLDLDERHAGDRRHAGDYWVAVFGTPGDDEWGVRFEGHHVSVHATVAGGEVRLTPLFLGANPAVVHDGGPRGAAGGGGRPPVSAPLAAEEAAGFELLAALTVEQRSSAIVAATAPSDIATRNAPSVGTGLGEEGVPLAALSGPAASAADHLLGVYLGRFPAGARRPDPDGARFAWAGGDEPGVGHYYRVAGPRLLVELDNTQNGANHVHTVVREPGADFGDDVLAAHHRHAH